MRVLAPLALILAAACSPETDIRSQLGDGADRPPVTLAPDVVVTIEVRGEHFKTGDRYGDLVIENVVLEIGPGRTLSLKRERHRLVWSDGVPSPSSQSELLDSVALEEAAYDALRARLAIYHPAELLSDEASLHSTRAVLTPSECEIPLGGPPSPVIIGFENPAGERGQFIFPAFCEGAGATAIERDLHAILDALPELDGFDSSWGTSASAAPE